MMIEQIKTLKDIANNPYLNPTLWAGQLHETCFYEGDYSRKYNQHIVMLTWFFELFDDILNQLDKQSLAKFNTMMIANFKNNQKYTYIMIFDDLVELIRNDLMTPIIDQTMHNTPATINPNDKVLIIDIFKPKIKLFQNQNNQRFYLYSEKQFYEIDETSLTKLLIYQRLTHTLIYYPQLAICEYTGSVIDRKLDYSMFQQYLASKAIDSTKIDYDNDASKLADYLIHQANDMNTHLLLFIYYILKFNLLSEFDESTQYDIINHLESPDILKYMFCTNKNLNVKQLAKTDEQYQDLITQTGLYKNKIVTIFAINKKISDKIKNKQKCMQAIHGTTMTSVSSILNTRFMLPHELKEKNVTHRFTGQGLGKGIYFASLDECQKSINYTSNSNNQYRPLFVCDLHYTTVYKTNKYNNNLQTDADLVVGVNIGSHNRSEYVIKDPECIEFKYLILLNKN